MKITYFMALGVFCAVLNSGEVRAQASAPSLASLHISAVATPTYGKCPVGHYPSKCLDNIYKGPNCYQCVGGTTWKTVTHTCS